MYQLNYNRPPDVYYDQWRRQGQKSGGGDKMT